MKCSKCGYDVSQESLFCHNCGSKMNEMSIKTRCNNCGAELIEEAEFCGKCGLPLRKAGATLKEKKNKEKGNVAVTIIIVLTVTIILLVAVMVGYIYYTNNSDGMESSQATSSQQQRTSNKKSDKKSDKKGDDEEEEISEPEEEPTPEPDVSYTPIPTPEVVREIPIPTAVPRIDLYSSSLTYKRMPEIHSTILTDDKTFNEIKDVIIDFDMVCANYMNSSYAEVPSQLRPGSTAYNQQVEYKNNHPTRTQYYDVINVINARQGGGYCYAWVEEKMTATENGNTTTETDHWVYKLSNDSDGGWYIEDYTSDPAFG